MKLQVLSPLFQQAVANQNTTPLPQQALPLKPTPADSFTPIATPTSQLRQGSEPVIIADEILELVAAIVQPLSILEVRGGFGVLKAENALIALFKELKGVSSESFREQVTRYMNKPEPRKTRLEELQEIAFEQQDRKEEIRSLFGSNPSSGYNGPLTPQQKAIIEIKRRFPTKRRANLS